jgi:hypothetical protein
MSDVIGIPPLLVADPRCVLYLRGDATNGSTRIRDWSPSHKTVTVYGNTCNSTAQTTFPPTSIYFDGTDDYLSLADSADWDLGNDYTIVVWFNSTTNSALARVLVGQFQDDSNFWAVYIDGTILSYYVQTGGVWRQVSTVPFTFSANTWYQIVLKCVGGTITYYANGVSLGTTPTYNTDLSTPLWINGTRQAGTAHLFAGYMDELAIWKGVAIPIEKLYPQKQRMIV